MSPTLTDASRVRADPSDGLAVLEARKSQAETFGIPLAVLAELTHRCPLQCPYCSNPIATWNCVRSSGQNSAVRNYMWAAMP